MARIIFCLMYAGAYMQKSCSNLRRDQASKLTKFCPDVITSYSSKFGVTVISNEIVFLQVYISILYGNFLLSKFVAISNLNYLLHTSNCRENEVISLSSSQLLHWKQRPKNKSCRFPTIPILLRSTVTYHENDNHKSYIVQNVFPT